MDRPRPGTYPRKPCASCGTLIARKKYHASTYARLTYCGNACASAARIGTQVAPEKRKANRAYRRIDPAPLPPARFVQGIAPQTTRCPRISPFAAAPCGGVLVREPAFFRCLVCSQLHPIKGAVYALQAEFETASVGW